MVAQTLELSTVTAVPSPEAIMDAVHDAVEALFDAAAERVTELYGPLGAELERPRVYRYVFGTDVAYELPTDWPALMICSTAIERQGGPDNLYGGEWRVGIDLHAWLVADDPDLLGRMLMRYGAALWLCLVSADDQQALAGAHVNPLTMGIGRGPDIGQTEAQRSVVLRTDMTVAV